MKNKTDKIAAIKPKDNLFMYGIPMATLEDLQKNGREISEHYARDMKLQKRALEKQIEMVRYEREETYEDFMTADKKISKSLSKKISDQSNKIKSNREYIDAVFIDSHNQFESILSDMRRYDSKIKWRDRIIFGLVVILVLSRFIH